MIIRPANEQDLAPMASLARIALSFAAPPEGGAWDSGSDSEIAARLRPYVTSEGAVSLVVEAGDALIGFAASHAQPNGKALLGILAVAPGHRGHGVGTRLVSDLVETLRAHRLKGLDVDVPADNAAAVRFWRRAGFSDVVLRMTMDLPDGARPVDGE